MHTLRLGAESAWRVRTPGAGIVAEVVIADRIGAWSASPTVSRQRLARSEMSKQDHGAMSALEKQLQSVESERDELIRSVLDLEEALALRNSEVQALVQRAQELEVTILHMQGSPAGDGAPKWEARLMASPSNLNLEAPLTSCPWEDDLAGRWLVNIVPTVQMIEGVLHDLDKTFRIELKGAAASRARQIKVLNGKVGELERHWGRCEVEFGEVIEQSEFLCKALMKILERELLEARKDNNCHLGCCNAPRSAILAKAGRPPASTTWAGGVQPGLLAAIDQAGRALGPP